MRPQTAEDYRDWWTDNAPVLYGYCFCGCGNLTNKADRTHAERFIFKGEPKRFLKDHASREPAAQPGTPEDPDRPTSARKYKDWWKRNAPEGVEYGECWCGCGQKTKEVQYGDRSKLHFKGEPIRYIKGHMGGRKSKSEKKPQRKRVVEIPVQTGHCIECKHKLNQYTIRAGLVTCGAHAHLDPNKPDIAELTA